jgi:hypothetical protein
MANKDASEYLETFEINAERYSGDSKKLHMRVASRIDLTGKCFIWYRELSKAVRGDWDQPQAELLAKYNEEDSFERNFVIQRELYNLKQLDRETDA